MFECILSQFIFVGILFYHKMTLNKSTFYFNDLNNNKQLKQVFLKMTIGLFKQKHVPFYKELMKLMNIKYIFTQVLYHGQDAKQWFEFSQTGCCNKTRETSLRYYLPITRGRRLIHAFPKDVSEKVTYLPNPSPISKI